MAAPVSSIFSNASGIMVFQPRFINWSYLNLGKDHRTHMKKKTRNPTLEQKTSNCSRLSTSGGSPNVCKYGNCHPPRYKVVITVEETIMLAYSARKNSANFMLEYSV